MINNIYDENNLDADVRFWWFWNASSNNNPVDCRIEANIFHDDSYPQHAEITNWKYNSPWLTEPATWWEDNQNSPAQWIDGTNQHDADPQMVDPANGDWRLSSSSSPAKDAGAFLATIASVSNLGGGEYQLTFKENRVAYMFFSKETYGITYTGINSDTVYTNHYSGGSGEKATVKSIDAHNKITISGAGAADFTAEEKITVVDWNGTKPDIGAHEYQGDQGSTPQRSYESVRIE